MRGRRPGVGPRTRPTDAQFLALFEPRGVVVAEPPRIRASSASWRSTTCWRAATAARCSPPTCRGSRCWASTRWRRIDDLPDGEADLVFVCTPASANVELLRACARKGIRAAFLTSAGYGEAGGGGAPRRGRAGRSGRRDGHPPGRAQRARGRVDPRQPLRPDRGALPAGRSHRRGQPERQLRVELPQLRRADRDRHQPGGVGGTPPP